MIRKIQQTIRSRQLLAPGQQVVAAVSGGADSVALAYALHHLRQPYRLRLTLAHLHHGIRGAAADEDAEFVRELALKLGMPFVTERIDVPALAAGRGISLEMAAREARYDFLARAAAEQGAQVLATGHTADDQAETVLLKLARGAGPQGLAGLAYRGEWKHWPVIRPLRDITHAQACAFLRRHGLAWREDATNLSLHFLRNRVRHDVLPLLETKLNPRLREVLLRTAEVIGAENAWLDELARERLDACVEGAGASPLRIAPWRREPLAARRRMLRLWLARGGAAPEAVDFEAIERILQLAEASAGSRGVPLAGGWTVWREYDRLRLKADAEKPGDGFRQVLSLPGETLVLEAGLRVTAEWSQGIHRQRQVVGRLPCEVTLEPQAVRQAGPLTIRSWQPGDRIRPLGLSGSRKLQDLFVDAKIPRDRRATVPLLEAGGEVVWVAGYRVARGWEVQNPEGNCLRIALQRI